MTDRRRGDAGADYVHPGEGGKGRTSAGPGPRREIGDAESSRRDPPHVTENAEGAPVQGSTPAPDDVSILPANAQGKDVVEAQNEVGEVDDESMYSHRPGEDKDRGKTEMP